MTVHDAYRQLSVTLQAIYERREANYISAIVIEYLTGLNNTERIVHKQRMFTQSEQTIFHYIVLDLLAHTPVQYALHEAHWCRMKLYVDEHVLIPRPETEELVAWVLDDVRIKMSDVPCTMLDVGTGSGCIAIALKKTLPSANVFAIDVSDKALEVAKRNAEEEQTDIFFFKADILDKSVWNDFATYNYIISNPPYIAEHEAADMSSNVLKHEPHLALFVPDNNPLLFYEAISSFGLQHLTAGGKLFFEINEMFGNKVADLLLAKGYRNVEIKKDMQGKDRMIKGERNG